MKKITNSCERARALYLKKQENEKILQENKKKEFAAKVFRHFKKIFPDIKYHEQKDEFELCGYYFDYGFLCSVYNSHYNYHSQVVSKDLNGYRGLYTSRKPIFLLRPRDCVYVYTIENMEDLGKFLIEQGKREVEKQTPIKPKSILERLTQWARGKGII